MLKSPGYLVYIDKIEVTWSVKSIKSPQRFKHTLKHKIHLKLHISNQIISVATMHTFFLFIKLHYYNG